MKAEREAAKAAENVVAKKVVAKAAARKFRTIKEIRAKTDRLRRYITR